VPSKQRRFFVVTDVRVTSESVVVKQTNETKCTGDYNAVAIAVNTFFSTLKVISYLTAAFGFKNRALP
jgi:hypothetical protein